MSFHPVPRWRWLAFAGVFLLMATVMLLQPYQKEAEQRDSGTVVTYSKGIVRTNIQYHAPRAGSGTLHLEVLNPEDTVVGHVQMRVTLAEGEGWWRQDVPLVKEIAAEDLAWHRLRYRFSYGGDTENAVEGTRRHRRSAAHPGDPHYGTAVLSERRAGGGAGDRHGFQKRAVAGRVRCASNWSKRRSHGRCSPAA